MSNLPSRRFPNSWGRALLFLALCVAAQQRADAAWKYFRTGSPEDSAAKPRAGFALMGGGSQQDPAFRFLCERTNRGDFLILRADTEDDYAKKVNEEIAAICLLNSVATIVFSSREDSSDPKLLEILRQAEAIYFAGGDQSNYVRFWQDTPVEEALNRHIAAGKPLGGSSAGLAILGEFSFSSMLDTIHSPQALADPYGNEVTLSRDFLRIPLLAGTITDTHFVKRDRLGRLLAFMARILQDGWATRVRAIGVDENAAVLLDPDGKATVVGGSAYFLEAKRAPNVCRHKELLRFSGIAAHRANAGAKFDVAKWSGEGDDYALSTERGEITAPGSQHGIY